MLLVHALHSLVSKATCKCCEDVLVCAVQSTGPLLCCDISAHERRAINMHCNTSLTAAVWGNLVHILPTKYLWYTQLRICVSCELLLTC
jgi:hypothetical protein